MPLRSFNSWRGRLAFHGTCVFVVSAWMSCSAPDGRDLFEPFGAASSGGASGGTGSAGSSAGVGAGQSSGGEGQGGSLSLAGSSGAGAGTGGAMVEAEASEPDAGPSDAGVDAAPPPVPCEPSEEICDGIDNDCDDAIDPGVTCPDGCIGFSVADHAYMYCNEGVDRGTALTRCGAEDMKLAWIETPEESAALVASISALDLPPVGDERVAQIAASDEEDEDEWIWAGNAAVPDGFQFWEGNADDPGGGEAVDGAYENWADGEPNDDGGEDCGIMSVSGNVGIREPGEWDDRNCLEELPFLCEEP